MRNLKAKWLLLLPIVALGLFFLFRGEGASPLSKKWQECRDFELLMGKQTFRWNYVQTREDKETLGFFKKLYEKNFEKALLPSEALKIPKTLHVVWLGPKEFPPGSVKNIASWIDRHPSWTVKFWTDIDRAAPHPAMQKVLVEDCHLPNLLSNYFLSDNFCERSELLRYEILLAEGGLYIDHDLLCNANFEPLNAAYDFYCGLEELAPSILSSSLFPGTHIIGSRAQHPVLAAAIDWVKRRWQQLEADYPGSDPLSVMNRVKHRSFYALNEGIHQKIDRDRNVDIVLPSAFFSQKVASEHAFATHSHEGVWLKQESSSEKKLIQDSEEILSRVATTELLLIMMTGFCGLLMLALVITYRRASHA
ncbi:MAG: hypothetical protein HYX48_03875 [Chlamydiales bacterium]|nr:hypothetical protein [Chlamydiales bacterium]